MQLSYKKLCFRNTLTSFVFITVFLFNSIHAIPQVINDLLKPEITSSEERLLSWDQHIKMEEESSFKYLKWRNSGPVFIGGRISSIAVPRGDNFTIYISAGSGGIWKTINNGTTWKSIFNNYPTSAIGDIEVAPSDPNIIWAGTGEELLARSSYAGIGVFKSTDAGETWENMGLHESHHIGRIVIDPFDPNIVYVAALGHEYSFNEERGLYKTTDGGKTWKKVLYVSPKAGVVEVVMDPSDNNILYAAAWERDRKAWNDIECGPGSGLYKSTDAGETWERLTNGFPDSEYNGRIGLAVSASNPKVIYALLDNQELKPEEEERSTKLSILEVKEMSEIEFLDIEENILDDFLRNNRVPEEYTAKIIKKMVEDKELTPEVLGKYLLDLYADRKLHNTNVKGGEVYRSDDKGNSWYKTHEGYFRSFFSTYGYSFCDIRVSPDDEDQIFILGIRMLASGDGGETFTHIGGKKNVHVDHHALWIDPDDPDHIINGNDGGLNFSYDRGETWQKIDNIPIAEFYSISLDMAFPYNIYGGTQDNGTVMGPSSYINEFAVPDPWKHLGGGDGFFVEADPVDPNLVYFEFQFGSIMKKHLRSNLTINIMPKVKIGEPALRANWMTPFKISTHNHLILYYGAQKLYKSLNMGENWISISPDLTTDPEEVGIITYGCITTISESALNPNLIYVGTDDGNIQVTKNGGYTWEKISNNLPNKWISKVVASKFNEGTVYVTMTGYRNDDFQSYIYKSDNYGKDWASITSNLPPEPANVIREDPDNNNVLYLGTDLGVYISINRGESWHSINNNMPTVAVYDLAIHPRAMELVAGTHGRGIYILDIRPVHEMMEKEDDNNLIFDIRPAFLPHNRGNGEWSSDQVREAKIYYYLKRKTNINIVIVNNSGKIIKSIVGTNQSGINIATWDLTLTRGTELGEGFGTSGRYARSGRYKVIISTGNKKLEKEFQVRNSSY